MDDASSPASKLTRHPLPAALIHDLRTPLSQILGYSEMLIEQAQEQGQDSYVLDLQHTLAAGKKLLALINDSFQQTSPTDSLPATVPRREEHLSPPDPLPAPAAPPADPAQGFILVVDDIEANRDVLTRRLSREGYVVATAEDGRQALEKLRANPFDLVLLDIMMPEMDGYEVLQRLQADDTLRHLPVIMISALDELDSVVRCIELGAADYLSKPFNPTLLKARIGACLEKKRAHDREAHLFAQLQLRNTEMAHWRELQDADLAVARTTQQAIIPAEFPQLAGWKVEAVHTPLIQVGGDVYGWRQLDRGVWLFWIADATGHGIAAALFTTLVAMLFNNASAASRTAHGILRGVNAAFYSLLRGRSFMTASCAVIDAEGRLTFAGAGHPPLLIRRSSGAIETLSSRHTMIGIDPSMKIDDTAASLAPGDIALLYTDGLYSLKLDGEERFTNQTVADAFARLEGSENVLPRLTAQLLERAGAQLFDDDLAAIALRRE